ncbi:MAG: UDP-N-acetylglucosamine 1-carboxyvinyltransferase, partial [Clostridia bacterium]|nr:UDP-N-acetylglucosamine 1-carboxyvinyltransferase [Clostridia bacterium]
MTIYQVEGGRPLTGELWAQGSKNAALPLLSAAVLAKEPVTLQNCPVIDDVAAQLEILRALGCTALRLGDSVRLEAGRAQGVAVPRELMGRMRSSVMLLGALLGRHRRGQICTPGGCAIGARPIDYHLRAFEQMGVRIEWEDDCLTARLDRARDSDLTLPYPSVGAT